MIFNKTKYTKWYFSIVNKAKLRQPTKDGESHHILPRSLGGSNDLTNLVKLTLREHFVVHLLLTKMSNLPLHTRKMFSAAYIIMQRKGQIKTSRLYEFVSRRRNADYSKRNKETKSHLRLHTKENCERGRLTKISRHHTSWNSGLHNPLAASNGKKGAAKMAVIATGRKRYYFNETNWTWAYKHQDKWYIREKLSKYSTKYNKIEV